MPGGRSTTGGAVASGAMRRSVRSVFVLGVLAGLIVALLRTLTRETRAAPAPLAAPPAPLPAITPPVRTPVPVDVVAPPEPEPVPAGGASWVDPVAGGCPDGHPIKAKVSSGIFHRPGGLSYERTRPDRCYASEAAAEADGFRAAKR